MRSLVSCLTAVLTVILLPAGAMAQGLPWLQRRLAALESEVASLQQQVNAYEEILSYLSVETGEINGLMGPHLIVTGANVHIRSGSGYTGDDGDTLLGLGNLIIGYDEQQTTGGPRTGSHNLVVGPYHSFVSYGGFVAGHENTLTGISSSVSGGRRNTASGDHSSISGGSNNTASGSHSSVSGGSSNAASGPRSSVSGGARSAASGDGSSVNGGFENNATNNYSSVSGGDSNTASGRASSVSGGTANQANGVLSSVSGGLRNIADGNLSSVSGGLANTASGEGSSVSGGGERSAPDSSSWAAGSLYEPN